MKIQVDIPDFEGLEKQRIRIFAGEEMVAYKYIGWNWRVKTKFCSKCGKCCMNLPPDDNFPAVKNGRCVYLKNDGDNWVCGLGSFWRPFGCVTSDDSDPKDYCTVKYKEVKE